MTGPVSGSRICKYRPDLGSGRPVWDSCIRTIHLDSVPREDTWWLGLLVGL